MRIIPTLLVLCAVLPRAGHAQLRDELYTTPVMDAPADTTPEPAPLLAIPGAAPAEARDGEAGGSTSAMVLGGVLGAGAGTVAGWLVGAYVDGEPDPDCIDFCFGPALVLGTLAGEALGLAAGVHLANGRRGSLPLSVLTSAGILAAGIMVGHEHAGTLVLVPVSQLVGAIWMERETPRRP